MSVLRFAILKVLQKSVQMIEIVDMYTRTPQEQANPVGLVIVKL